MLDNTNIGYSRVANIETAKNPAMRGFFIAGDPWDISKELKRSCARIRLTTDYREATYD
ncbi:MAG: hypothetical protein ACRC38_00215 [Plesiomonas sp.]